MKTADKYQLTKYACYTTGFSMSVVATLSPLLFVTFKNMYGISYTSLGFLVVLGFLTQFFIDLVFTFFSDKFNIYKTVRKKYYRCYALGNGRCNCMRKWRQAVIWGRL